MKLVATLLTKETFKLPGGKKEDDIPVFRYVDPNGQVVVCSTWELTALERKTIAEGGSIELWVWGQNHPPVTLEVKGTENG